MGQIGNRYASDIKTDCIRMRCFLFHGSGSFSCRRFFAQLENLPAFLRVCLYNTGGNLPAGLFAGWVYWFYPSSYIWDMTGGSTWLLAVFIFVKDYSKKHSSWREDYESQDFKNYCCCVGVGWLVYRNILPARKSRHDVFGHHPNFDRFDTSVEYLQGRKKQARITEYSGRYVRRTSTSHCGNRDRADYDGVPYWSGSLITCPIPGLHRPGCIITPTIQPTGWWRLKTLRRRLNMHIMDWETDCRRR